MRVVVASDEVRELDSLTAGGFLAKGWAPSAQVALAGIAAGGEALARIAERRWGGEFRAMTDGWVVAGEGTAVVGADLADGGWNPASQSRGLGRAVLQALTFLPTGVPGRLVVDLSRYHAMDAGEGLLEVAGAAIAGVVARGGEVVATVAQGEQELPLLGLRGSMAARAFEYGVGPADRLIADARYSAWLDRLGLADGPGVGAAAGLGSAMLACGARVVATPAFCLEIFGLRQTLRQADLLVTGCTGFHVGNRGGDLVRLLAEVAEQEQRPCLVFAAEVGLGRREMRTFGVEAAYPIGPGDTSAELQATAERVAAGWTAG